MRCLRSLLLSGLLLLALPLFANRKFTIGYEWDDLHQLVTLTYPDGSQLHATYDNELGLPSTLTYTWGASSVVFVDAIRFDSAGLLVGISGDGNERNARYDGLGQLKELSYQIGSRTEYRASGFLYNLRGQLKGYLRSDPSLSGANWFDYTAQGQLRSARIGSWLATYRYDKQGNLTGSSGFSGPTVEVPTYTTPPRSFDARNRRAGWSYDRAGRLLRDDRLIYTYDEAGELAMIRDLRTRIPLETYLYDAKGRRIRTCNVKEGSETYAVYDVQNRLISETIERSMGGDEVVNYIYYGDRIIGKMTQYAGDETQRKTEIFNDFLGSPTVVVRDGAMQETPVATHHEYAPYGYQKANRAHDGPGGYTGHEDDGATGLTYMMARSYDPVRARFLTPDPARDFNYHTPITLNLYQYAHNDPLNQVDRFGLETSREVAKRWAAGAAINKNGFMEYFNIGMSGLFGMADNLSHVVDYTISGRAGHLSKGDLGLAALSVFDVTGAKASQVASVGRTLTQVDDVGNAVNHMVAAVDSGMGARVALTAADEVAAVASVGKSLSTFQKAADFGIDTYKNLKKAKEGMGIEWQAHHIIPEQFKKFTGKTHLEMLAVVLHVSEHKVFTQKWVKYYATHGLNPQNASKEKLLKAAREIYAEYPDLIKAAEDTFR